LSNEPLKVLAVAPRSRSRDSLLRLLARDTSFEVCPPLSNPGKVTSCAKKLRPDAIIFSDRLEAAALVSAITEVMIDCPTPILILSGDEQSAKSAVALKALSAGALCVLRLAEESKGGGNSRLERELLATVRAMAQVKLVRRWRQKEPPAPAPERRRAKGAPKVVAIAASTGGPAALKTILDALPGDFPAPILVVQHIAHGFIAGVAEWLDQSCKLEVTIARDGERLRAGAVYLAPDELHLGVANRSSVELSRQSPVNGFRPSANRLFDSVGRIFAGDAIAVILTGMGEDGLEGLRQLARSGGRIIAQSEASSVVFGMPGVAVRHGLADQVLAPDAIARALVDLCSEEGSK
jgi:two-component system chemotaxis response regulator CheB